MRLRRTDSRTRQCAHKALRPNAAFEIRRSLFQRVLKVGDVETVAAAMAALPHALAFTVAAARRRRCALFHHNKVPCAAQPPVVVATDGDRPGLKSDSADTLAAAAADDMDP